MLFRRRDRSTSTARVGTVERAPRACTASVPLSAATAAPSAAFNCNRTTSEAETPTRKRVVFDWGSATHGGHRRDHNEDSFYATAPVFVVADSMGGHAAGELASRAVVQSLATLGGRTDVTDADLRRCITQARNEIGRIECGDGKPPGSTLTGVVVSEREDPCWTVLNIGDSRTYLLDDDALTQLTTDHSVAQELVDNGAISPQAARTNRFAHVLTRAVLHAEAHPLDVNEIPLHRGDRILVCSDGVCGPLDNDRLAALLRAHASPTQAAQAIVDAVVAAGGTDDATALVIDATEVVDAA
ncbi:MAG: serine/threonine-protein phosphatase [Mycobacterium sp.]|nr:serine/threonine-protein phosphatase [Mycobacterium sp.]